MYILNLIRERKCENETWVDTFVVDDKVKEPQNAVRAAVKEYLETEDGKKAITYTCHDFNWGDAITSIPEKIWEKHGLHFQTIKSVDMLVNQDEVLCDPYNIDEEE